MSEALLPEPDVQFSFTLIQGDKLIEDEIEGTISGSPALDTGGASGKFHVFISMHILSFVLL